MRHYQVTEEPLYEKILNTLNTFFYIIWNIYYFDKSWHKMWCVVWILHIFVKYAPLVWFRPFSSSVLQCCRLNRQIKHVANWKNQLNAQNRLTTHMHGVGCVGWDRVGWGRLWPPETPWWTEHGNLTYAPEDERCAFDWISHKDVLLWSLLRLKAEWIWEALCTAFACPVMKYYSLFTGKPVWKDMEMKQTELISGRNSRQRTKHTI